MGHCIVVCFAKDSKKMWCIKKNAFFSVTPVCQTIITGV